MWTKPRRYNVLLFGTPGHYQRVATTSTKGGWGDFELLHYVGRVPRFAYLIVYDRKYVIAQGDDLESMRSVEWAYVTTTFSRYLPSPESAEADKLHSTKDRAKWVQQHFSDVAEQAKLEAAAHPAQQVPRKPAGPAPPAEGSSSASASGTTMSASTGSLPMLQPPPFIEVDDDSDEGSWEDAEGGGYSDGEKAAMTMSTPAEAAPSSASSTPDTALLTQPVVEVVDASTKPTIPAPKPPPSSISSPVSAQKNSTTAAPAAAASSATTAAPVVPTPPAPSTSPSPAVNGAHWWNRKKLPTPAPAPAPASPQPALRALHRPAPVDQAATKKGKKKKKTVVGRVSSWTRHETYAALAATHWLMEVVSESWIYLRYIEPWVAAFATDTPHKDQRTKKYIVILCSVLTLGCIVINLCHGFLFLLAVIALNAGVVYTIVHRADIVVALVKRKASHTRTRAKKRFFRALRGGKGKPEKAAASATTTERPKGSDEDEEDEADTVDAVAAMLAGGSSPSDGAKED